jgi:hypothetical protein
MGKTLARGVIRFPIAAKKSIVVSFVAVTTRPAQTVLGSQMVA